MFSSILSDARIVSEKGTPKRIAVKLADERTGSLVIGDIGGILGDDIAHDLVDGIVSLFAESLVHSCKDLLHLSL